MRLDSRQQPIEAKPGERGERRHNEQKMSEARVRGAAVDYFADHRKDSDEGEQGGFQTPVIAG